MMGDSALKQAARPVAPQEWHVVLTHPQQERQAAENIRAGRFDPVRLGLGSPRLPAGVQVGQVVAYRDLAHALGARSNIEAGGSATKCIDVFAPTFLRPLRRRRNSADRKRPLVERPLFPGYVFVRFGPAYDWGWLLAVPGVRGLLARDGRLVTVPAESRGHGRRRRPGMDDLLAAYGGPPSARPVVERVQVGQEVELRDDAWAGVVGRVAGLDAAGRLRVALTMFGGAHEVATTVDKVTPL